MLSPYIRAGTGPSGPSGSSLQASVSGSATIVTPEGAVQSVSGEVSLPAGLYFNHELDSLEPGYQYGGCLNAPGSCVVVNPNISQDPLDPTNYELDSMAIEQLNLLPGSPLPGSAATSPVAVAGIEPQDFNAQAALKVYNAIADIDAGTGTLSDLVSLIRAGYGSTSSTPSGGQAIASGAISTVFTNGATQTVSGEISLPSGQYFAGSTGGCATGFASNCFATTPAYTAANDGTILSLPHR